ncbi:hypothetical protein P171DRAFT_439080 [Karstenula rhodostoma CBS 690.94]|uniref:Uncharacterized protein n=1 Tax=Karstenula rhodostoma CBS 690.94 TaxID=1392251 RepID=A0A9P4PX39_9PLEO|nr:hypothetical protein P171DRAFT_439080 [Karstenula rhodostoma CBS 690.94]
MQKPPVHKCEGPQCRFCVLYKAWKSQSRVAVPSPAPPNLVGDSIVADLDKWAAEIKRQCADFEESVNTIGPRGQAFAYGLIALIKDGLKNITRNKDYYLGLCIAIEAETRRPAHEQNAKLLAGYRNNQKDSMAQIKISRLDLLARMQAYADKGLPMASEVVNKLVATITPTLGESLMAYRAATGI